MIKSEDRIQQECVMWYHNNYPNHRKLLFSVPNGGARSSREGALFKKTGLIAGVSDLILLNRKGVLLLEAKNEIGTQSKKQIDWQERVVDSGFDYVIFRNLDEFISIVKPFMSRIVLEQYTDEMIENIAVLKYNMKPGGVAVKNFINGFKEARDVR